MTNKTLVRIRVWVRAWIKIYMRTRNYYQFYKHLSGMLDDVVKAKQSGVTRVEVLPQMPKNIVKEPKPSKQTIIEKHTSRMSR